MVSTHMTSIYRNKIYKMKNFSLEKLSYFNQLMSPDKEKKIKIKF